MTNRLLTFGHPIDPCSDCIDGECTMNCSVPKEEDCSETDYGSVYLSREENVMKVTVRGIGRTFSSSVDVPLGAWKKMISVVLVDYVRDALYEWIKEDAPTSIKMVMNKKLADKLVDRLCKSEEPQS